MYFSHSFLPSKGDAMLVVIEESYKISVWCREILDGLKQEARKKRVSLSLSTKVEDIESDTEDSCVMIIGAETEWLNIAASVAKSAGKHPIILSNQSDNSPEVGVSRVTEDIYGSMSEIMRLFAAKKHKSVALYAHNPDSASDNFKKEAFLRSNGQSDDIFQNEGSLKECFDRFYEKHKEKRYCAIVCSNDFAAISLIRHLKNAGEDIRDIDIISYSNTFISRYTSPAVSTVRANFKSFGQLAFMIDDCISKGENVSGIRILCSWEIIHRETSSPCALSAPESTSAERSGSFYTDPELMEMMRIETLISECDDTDLEIVKAILGGKKTSEIESVCFLTETAVKYRIKKMKDICHAESRAQLKDILSKYLSSGIDKLFTLSYN